MSRSLHAPTASTAASAPAKITRLLGVIQITWSLEAGGSERYTVDIASTLDRDRYAPQLCALDSGGPLELEAQASGIPYSVLERRSGISLRLVWELYRLFRSTHTRIVHTHHFSPLFYSFLGAKLVGARLIHTEHGLSTYTTWRHRVALRFFSRFCSAVVAVGTESERVLRERVGIASDKLFVIPGGVRTERFNVPKQQARAALQLRQSDRVAVIVARLSPEKNHRMLLTAFHEVTKKVKDARLLIVGEGPEQAAIAEEVRRLGLGGSVNMLGVRRDIPEILAACDVFLLSSLNEALPIAVLEAMAAGLPVVATDVGDVHTVIGDGVNGRLVPSGDAAAFAAATIDLMSAAELSKKMGKEGKVRAQEFSVQSMVRRYEELYLSR